MTVLSKYTTIAVVFSVITVMSAGCAGWGDDGLQTPEADTGSNGEAQEDVDPNEKLMPSLTVEQDILEKNILTVHVTDAGTAEPVAGATIYVVGADGDPADTTDLEYEAETNQSGVAQMEVVAAMNYVISVGADGYEDGHGDVFLDRETEIEVEPDG